MSGERRYQIFISSTFIDLKDERTAVQKAILRLNHIPAGMELFPASDSSAWELIKKVIDNSDYYVLIIGGRYGSLDKEGLGFTEKEYLYAIEKKKPVLAFLHKKPQQREISDTDPDLWGKLLAFRKKVEETHTKIDWETPEELAMAVISSLALEIQDKPAVGWVRGDQAVSTEGLQETLEIIKERDFYKAELEKYKTQETPDWVDSLISDSKVFSFSYSYNYHDHNNGYIGNSSLDMRLDEIFPKIAMFMSKEISITNAYKHIKNTLTKVLFEKGAFNSDNYRLDIKYQETDVDNFFTILENLGLIEKSAIDMNTLGSNIVISKKGGGWIKYFKLIEDDSPSSS